MIEDRKPKFFYGYVIVVAAFLIQVVGFGIYSSYGIFFNPLLVEFGWSRAVISGAASLFVVMMGLFSMIVGGLNDRFGPRITVAACGFFWGLGYLLMSQVNTVWQLYLFYGLIAGMGVSGIDVLPLTTIARWYVRRRGMMSGVVKMGAGVGILSIPLVVSWLISSYGWRTSFSIIGIVALVFMVLVAQFLRRDPSQVGQLPYGQNEAEPPSSNSGTGVFSLRRAIHTRQFWMLCVIYLLIIFFGDAILVHIVLHAMDFGVSPTGAASILAVIGGVSILGRFITGSAGDRVGSKWVMIFCLLIVAATFFWLQVAGELWMLYLFAVVYGFAQGGLFTLMSPWVAELFGLSSHGAIFGAVAFGGTIGGAFGPVIFGRIFDVTGSYQLAFLLSAVISIIAIIVALFLKPITSVSRDVDAVSGS